MKKLSSGNSRNENKLLLLKNLSLNKTNDSKPLDKSEFSNTGRYVFKILIYSYTVKARYDEPSRGKNFCPLYRMDFSLIFNN